MRLASVVGARPQFIKAAPVSRTIATSGDIDEVIIHTGQHYDSNMSASFFDELGLPNPAYNLGVGSGSHAQQTANMLVRLEPALLEVKPDIVLVYGDTNSTLAAALTAAKLTIPVCHVEAGLRSFRRDMPEETNRVVTDHLASMLLCPSQRAVDNLAAEGITSGVFNVGDVMYDALIWQLGAQRKDGSPALSNFGLVAGEYVLATLHRAENTDDPNRFLAIVDGLAQIAALGVTVILPAHPRVKPRLEVIAPAPRLIVAPPVSYGDMISLAADARAIVTDSGGLQKEAYWLGTPCVTVRGETEWPETLEQGWNIVVDCDPHRIVNEALRSPPADPAAPVYGNGRAASQIVQRLMEWNTDAASRAIR